MLLENKPADWLFVEDNAVEINLVFHKDKNYETYNIGSFNELQNTDLVKFLCTIMDEKLG
jgi:dTDP-glucose 4,6-dehydratase